MISALNSTNQNVPKESIKKIISFHSEYSDEAIEIRYPFLKFSALI